MTSESQPTRASPSQERGAIDSGETGEKVAGIDPAAAPMETDAEAGGAPTLPVANTQPRTPPKNHNATSTGTAMRLGTDKRAAPLAVWKIAMLCLVGVLVVGLLAVSQL